jgi:hypothetical protein
MLEQLSYLAEIVGGGVVAVTLIFLVAQLKQNTRMLVSAATQGAHDQIGAIYHPLMSDPSLAELFLKGGAELEDLSPAETVRLYSWYLTTIFQVQNWYFQARQGAMRMELLERWSQVIGNLHQTLPGFVEMWKQRRYVFAPEFASWMENEVFTREQTPGYRPLGAAVEGHAST